MKTFLKYGEPCALIAVPLALVVCAVFGFAQTAFLTLIVVAGAITLFFTGFEASRPGLRQVMPAAVLGALAAAGRILFAPLPDIKPVTAICILSGVVFGKRTGFMVGALAALISNFFFGHGPWTPWQMYAWGMAGYCAGVLAEKGLFGQQEELAAKHTTFLVAYGAFASLCYGVLLNSWFIIGFVNPLTWQSALLAYGAALPFDIVHAIATAVFLIAISVPWRKKLERVKQKYASK